MDIPYLGRDANGVPSLIVDGKPYLGLGGELHNSSSSSLEYLEEQVWPAVEALGLDTVIAPIAWESIEPVEGNFDFSLLDGMLRQAREHSCKLILLWFGLWKNGESMYVPEWVKEETGRFFRAMCTPGIPSQTISPFCAEGVEADAKAFARLMKHLAARDEERTVILVQVENEVGLLGAERDMCPVAADRYREGLPQEMPGTGGRTGSWRECFGEDAPEYFMAYYYARALEVIASAGKREYPIPMYANAWLSQFPERPGAYPSGGPVAGMLPVWRAVAPSLDLLAPDIYLPDFKQVCDGYATLDKPLLIPEARRDPVSASNAFYAIGHYNTVAFAPFGIDGLPSEQEEPDEALAQELNIDMQAFCAIGSAPYLAASYRLLAGMKPLLLEYRGTGRNKAFLRENGYQRGIILPMAGIDLQISYSPERYRRPGSAGIVLEMDDGDFYVAGCNFQATVLPKRDSETLVTPVLLQEGTFVQGKWKPGRVLNGDERRQTGIGDMAGALRMRVSVSPIR